LISPIDSASALDSGAGPEEELFLLPPPSEPMSVARIFLAERGFETDAHRLLRSYRGSFLRSAEANWEEIEERRLRSDLYAWLEPAWYKKPNGTLARWAPTKAKVGNVVDALHAATHLDRSIEAPAWLDENEPFPANEAVAVANGLLNIRTRELVTHTPAFFSLHALPFGYDPGAPAPARWESFLGELSPDDQESIDTLAEIMGYILSGDTRQQKMFLAVGPKRSGKGTIGRVLTGLLGAHNTAAPTLSGLTTNFGLAPLIGKPLAIISDARLGARADSNMVAVERLLSISGEDTLTIDRKYLDGWTGRLPSRFLILTNEIPRFTDASGALASRFILLVLNRSFYGQEDPTLTEQLLAEAPGIFNWALAGLDRLLDRGHFLQPASAREALRHLEDLSSPVGAFVRDLCLIGSGFEIDKNILYTSWKDWCEDEGRRPGTKAIFVRDLRAATPGITPTRPRDGEHRRRALRGIDLRAHHPDLHVSGRGTTDNDADRPRATPDHPAQPLPLDQLDPTADPPSVARRRVRPPTGPGWTGVQGTVDQALDVAPDEIERLAALYQEHVDQHQSDNHS
jgi:putative DNA primase/helicase